MIFSYMSCFVSYISLRALSGLGILCLVLWVMILGCQDANDTALRGKVTQTQTASPSGNPSGGDAQTDTQSQQEAKDKGEDLYKKANTSDTSGGGSSGSSASKKFVKHTDRVTITGNSSVRNLPVRILFMVDNSYSMAGQTPKVRDGLNNLVTTLSESDKDVRATIFSCFSGHGELNHGGCMRGEFVDEVENNDLIDLIKVPEIDGQPDNAGRTGVNSWQSLFLATALLAKDHIFKAGIAKNKEDPLTADDLRSADSTAEKVQELVYIDDEETKRRASDRKPRANDFLGYSVILKHETNYLQKLKDYFKPDQINLLVLLTGGESTLSVDEFITFATANYGSVEDLSSLKVYTFFNYRDTDIAESNSRELFYHRLTQAFQGEVFNLKNSEDSTIASFFEDIDNKVTESTQVVDYALQYNCRVLKKVMKNKEELPLESFSCLGKTLSVTAEGVVSTDDELEVTYFRKK